MEKSVKIIFITGGQRSGKSRMAEEIAIRLSSNPIYIATARILDSEMERRVAVHRERRGPEWRNVESPLLLDIELGDGDVALLDCLTMFAANHFFDSEEDVACAVSSSIAALEDFFQKSGRATLIVVTNEIGLGGVSSNVMQRHFADVQGQLNQWVAARADEAYMVVSGLRLQLPCGGI